MAESARGLARWLNRSQPEEQRDDDGSHRIGEDPIRETRNINVFKKTSNRWTPPCAVLRNSVGVAPLNDYLDFFDTASLNGQDNRRGIGSAGL
jgi:hypothetical protein